MSGALLSLSSYSTILSWCKQGQLYQLPKYLNKIIINNKYIEEWNIWAQYLLQFDSDDRLTFWFLINPEVRNNLTSTGVSNLK